MKGRPALVDIKLRSFAYLPEFEHEIMRIAGGAIVGVKDKPGDNVVELKWEQLSKDARYKLKRSD